MYVNGRFLKKIRESLGLRREKVAEDIGYSWSSIHKIETKGSKTCELAIVARLAIYYEVDINYIINFRDVKRDLEDIDRINNKHDSIS